MFHFSQGNTQAYSLFGSYVVQQHDAGCLKRYVEDLPRPDLKLGKDHLLTQSPRMSAAPPEKIFASFRSYLNLVAPSLSASGH